jgi:hydrogenase large subunit
MPKTYLPLVSGSAAPAATKKIAIDPIPRIEGHLRLEVLIQDGKVTDAWSSGTSFGGMELILRGRDPRDAWVYAQRMCGVCTTVHALASVRAVENALGITIPDNARIVRNLIESAQFIQDHVVHFYHLHGLDWVDLVGALSADPGATSTLQRQISDWPNSSAQYFAEVQARLDTYVNSGQLGLFANAYWGHPAYRLPPEANLMAVAHYLEALEWQREVAKIQAILGGKNPHPQTYLVGGVAVPVDPTQNASIGPQTIAQLRNLAAKALAYVTQVYIPDLKAIASYYPDWAALGGGPGNYLSYGDFPVDSSGGLGSYYLQSGIVLDRKIDSSVQFVDQNRIREYVARSWYSYPAGDGAPLHPSQGVTQPTYTGPAMPYDFLNTDGKYSWLKAPRYDDRVMEVGPLARMVVAYASGHQRVRELVSGTLAELGLPTDALFSTLGRVAARGIETQLLAEQLDTWVLQLDANMQSGNLAIHNNTRWDPSTWPAQASGWGSTEAPRGALAHWVAIENGKIANYQAVVATTWNGSPRDAAGQPGAWEQALIGTPVADPARPVEILRTVHSFDPCMACSVHLMDVDGREMTRIRVVE